MRLFLVLVFALIVSFTGIQESFAKYPSDDYQMVLTDSKGNSFRPEYLGEETFFALHSTTTFNNNGKPIEAQVSIVCGPNNVILYNQTKTFGIADPRTIIDSFIPSYSGVYTITMISKEISETSLSLLFTGALENHCDPESIKDLPPLKQRIAGVFYSDIVCKDGLSFVLKNSRTPVCVKQETLTKLTERGMANHVDDRPIEERLSSAKNYVDNVMDQLPITSASIEANSLDVMIHERELQKIHNAREYYETLLKETFPYVPVNVAFGTIPANLQK